MERIATPLAPAVILLALAGAVASGCVAKAKLAAPPDSGTLGTEAGPRDAAVQDASAADAGGADAAAAGSDAGDAGDAGSGGAGDAGVPADAGSSTVAHGGFFCDHGIDEPGLTVPPGFCVKRFADVPMPRVLQFAPNGDLFVSSPGRTAPGGTGPGLGEVIVLPDDDNDGVADAQLAFAGPAELGCPANDCTVHGILFTGDRLLFTLEEGVYSLPYRSGDRHVAVAAPELVADLSDHGDHVPYDRWTHTLALSANGSLYVSRGQYDNESCPNMHPASGAVLRIGTGAAAHGDVIISGLRNPMYTRCKPWGACYAAELSGDGWSGYGGEEKLVMIQPGDDYGYPCCVGPGIRAPNIASTVDCSGAHAAAATFTLHDTPFGFDWETAGLWPAPYRGGFFLALHGAFGTLVGVGVSWAPADGLTHVPTSSVSPFVRGFGQYGPGPVVNQRPADVVFAPDGRLFIADDGGAVYWVAPRSLPRP